MTVNDKQYNIWIRFKSVVSAEPLDWSHMQESFAPEHRVAQFENHWCTRVYFQNES